MFSGITIPPPPSWSGNALRTRRFRSPRARDAFRGVSASDGADFTPIPARADAAPPPPRPLPRGPRGPYAAEVRAAPSGPALEPDGPVSHTGGGWHETFPPQASLLDRAGGAELVESPSGRSGGRGPRAVADHG